MKDNLVRVFLYGREVCQLLWKGGYKDDWGKVGALVSFHPDFYNTGLDIDPLGRYRRDSLFLRNGLSDICRAKEYEGLPRFLSCSLPDDWGNQVFSSWAAKNELHKKDITSVDKLAFIGKRGMGGFEFVPEFYSAADEDNVRLEELYALAREIEATREGVSIELRSDTSLNDLMAVGMSAGGRHPKAIIAIDWDTWEVRSGQVLLPENFTQHILKFNDNDKFPTAEVEYVYYQMARECGIEMEKCRLLPIGGANHFLTTRFDRKCGKKVHATTLNATAGEIYSYEDIFTVCRKLRMPYKDMEQLFRRAVFNYLACVCDDHDKNFSFTLSESGRWRLSSAYDETFTLDYVNRFIWDRHAMSLGGENRRISYNQLLALAEDNNIANARTIVAEVSAAVNSFAGKAEENGIEKPYTDFVTDCLLEHAVIAPKHSIVKDISSSGEESLY